MTSPSGVVFPAPLLAVLPLPLPPLELLLPPAAAVSESPLPHALSSTAAKSMDPSRHDVIEDFSAKMRAG
jgi:hypothetical protein